MGLSERPPVESPTSASPVLENIAHHEAGHVVVGHKLGLTVLDADIETDDEGGRGHTNFAHPGAWFNPRPSSLTPAERDFIDRVLTTFMAGIAAESRAGQIDPEGSGYDLDQSTREWARYLAVLPEARARLLPDYLRRASELVAEPDNWRAVERVAQALLERRRLDGESATSLAAGL